jgi:cytosine/adenosine deaminase-related metal-dependent hydrolase
MNHALLLIEAALIADARGIAAPRSGYPHEPGAMLVRLPVELDPRVTPTFPLPGPAHILALGHIAEVRRHEAAAHATTVRLPGHLLLPGLVNAHTHLDLTHIGPQPRRSGSSFVEWVDMIRAGRATIDEDIAASVSEGIRRSLLGGTVAIGDIAGAPRGIPSLIPHRTLTQSPLLGVSFVEFFAIGTGRRRGIDAITAMLDSLGARCLVPGDCRLGLQPHAPNTVALDAYQHAVTLARKHGLPLCTHLAETPEEHEFVKHARGPQRDMLHRLGVWTEDVLDHIGMGNHPAAHLAPVLRAASTDAPRGFLVAHVNDCTDDTIATLASTRTSVAYCPHASAYFEAHTHFGPHRYQDMLAAGVNVCLGTDSIVNLPNDRAAISILAEMAFLTRRDATDPLTLLAMATTNGANALGIDPALFLFNADTASVGAIAIPLSSDSASPINALSQTIAASESGVCRLLWAGRNFHLPGI